MERLDMAILKKQHPQNFVIEPNVKVICNAQKKVIGQYNLVSSTVVKSGGGS